MKWNFLPISTILLLISFEVLSYEKSSNDYIVDGNLAFNDKDCKLAIAYFDSAIVLEPRSYLAHYGKGMAYERMNVYDTALYYVRKSISYRDDFANAHFLSGLIRYKLNLYSKCIHDFDVTTKLNRGNTDAINLRALAKDKRGLYQSSSIDYHILSEKKPEMRQFPLLASIALMRMDSLYAGIVLLDKLVQTYPDYDTAYFYKGIGYTWQKNYDSAIATFTKVLEINPNYYEAVNFRGRALQMRDSTQDENEDLRKWKLMNPDAVQYYMDLGYDCLYNIDSRNAIIYFKVALSFDSTNTEAMNNIANCYIRIGYEGEAIKWADKSLEIKPDNIYPLFLKLKANFELYEWKRRNIYYEEYKSTTKVYWRAFKYNWDKEYFSVIKLADKVLELDPMNQECYIILGDFWRIDGSFRKSLNNYNKALEISQEPIIYYKKAWLYLNDKDYEEAIEEIEKSIKIDPKDIDYLLVKAYILAAQNNLIEANKIYDELIETSIDLSNVYYLRGLMKMTIQKNYRAACLDFDMAIEIDPYNYSAYQDRSTAKYYLDDEKGSQADDYLYRKYRGFLLN